MTQEHAELRTGRVPAIDIEAIRSSFQALGNRLDEVIATFYESLFASDERIKAMFDDVDMEGQRWKLASTLMTVMQVLDQPEVLLPALHDLGKHHQDLGVRSEDYAVVARCLVDAMAKAAGDAWGDETVELWRGALADIATEMQSPGSLRKSA